MISHPTYSIKLLLAISLVLAISCGEAEKKQDSEHKFTNALAEETSPYLLQHAHNPVHWRSWSPEAFEDAKKEDKLVLVSIGYSSCHWCHVMEEETFEDEEVAKVMNDNFISIKVDREERPDVDHIYQTFLQGLGDNGGWPLNVITLPNGKPLYGGTYHTNEQWTQVLQKINEMYKGDPEKAAEYSDMVAQGIAEVNMIQPTSGFEALTQEVLNTSVANWKPYWDLGPGGDQGEEKFMIPTNLDFLLDYAELSGDAGARSHVKNTLDKMAMGGIYDHAGGGFFRYSTDPQWKVPHFEKMLYDNAQAIGLYSKAYTIFREDRYREIVEGTIDFLEREMKDTQGGYHAALDSQSGGEEGKFYVWSKTELEAVLGKEFELFVAYYNIRPEAIWEAENYILHADADDGTFAKEHSMSMEDLRSAKAKWTKDLLGAREKRVPPGSDDKIITSWNALLINGLVDAYHAFGEATYLERAEGVFQFLMEKNHHNGELVHTYKEGSRLKEGFLEDYAFLIDAGLKLYMATSDEEYLETVQKLAGTTEKLFSDDASGMYHYNSGDELIAKIIKTNDGDIPSPNAVMAHNLFRLGHIVYDVKMIDRAKQMLSAMVPALTQAAPSYSRWNKLLLHNTYPYFEIAVVGKNSEPLAKDLNAKHIPNALVLSSKVESGLPLFKGRYVEDGTYIYVCQNSTCKLPVETVEAAMGQMANF